MAFCGSKQVEMVGLDDKREVTALLCVTLSAVLLPPQIVYTGKTDACHPQVKFPEGWCISHTENHWSTELSTIHFINSVVLPYVSMTREKILVFSTRPSSITSNFSRTFRQLQLYTFTEKMVTLHTLSMFILLEGTTCGS